MTKETNGIKEQPWSWRQRRELNENPWSIGYENVNCWIALIVNYPNTGPKTSCLGPALIQRFSNYPELRILLRYLIQSGSLSVLPIEHILVTVKLKNNFFLKLFHKYELKIVYDYCWLLFKDISGIKYSEPYHRPTVRHLQMPRGQGTTGKETLPQSLSNFDFVLLIVLKRLFVFTISFANVGNHGLDSYNVIKLYFMQQIMIAAS